MSIQLEQSDFEHAVTLLSRHGEWRSVGARIEFMTDVFAGSSEDKILSLLNLDGSPRGTAVHVIQRLAAYGRDVDGRETLGVLINKLIAYLGGGNDVDFLRGMLERYPFVTKPVAARAIRQWNGRDSRDSVTEKVIGDNSLRDIFVLEFLIKASRAVVRILTPEDRGTGFLIAPDLVITNNHVIPSEQCACKSQFQFNYQLDNTGRGVTMHTSLPYTDDRAFFYTSPFAEANATESALDYTIVRILDVPADIKPLKLGMGAVSSNSRVAIIQHPGGSYKKVSTQNNFIEYVDSNIVQYTTSTEPGSSGAPVFDDSLNVIAIHHAGGNLIEPSSSRRYLRNEGIRTAAIMADLKRNASAIYDLLQG